MNLPEAMLLVTAGFGAGAVNAVAGGGSLISFPALLGAGLASVPANVTNTVALWPGYAGGAFGYRRELQVLGRRLVAPGLISLIGATAGAVLLLTSPDAVFASLVPWLVLTGTLLFAIQPAIARRVQVRQVGQGKDEAQPKQALLGVLLASVYGSYFGAGLGVMILAVLGIYEPDDLQALNAMKNALSMTINTVALVAFAAFGPVDWVAVLVMALASLGGGYLGAVLARRLPPKAIRWFVIAFGLLVTAKLFTNRF